jgi:hypothetical protein
MSVSCECCVSGRGLCDGLITRSEESYRLCVCLIVCDLETCTVRRPRPDLGLRARGKERKAFVAQMQRRRCVSLQLFSNWVVVVLLMYINHSIII